MFLTSTGPRGPVFILRPKAVACTLPPAGLKVRMSGALNEGNVGGYSVAYSRDDVYFPVYITAAFALIFVTAAWIMGAAYWLGPADAGAAFTYFNIPLLQTRRPTTGRNPDGNFIY